MQQTMQPKRVNTRQRWWYGYHRHHHRIPWPAKPAVTTTVWRTKQKLSSIQPNALKMNHLPKKTFYPNHLPIDAKPVYNDARVPPSANCHQIQ